MKNKRNWFKVLPAVAILVLLLVLVFAAPVSATIAKPTVTEAAATSISYTGATFNGAISVTGGENAFIKGFKWGTKSGSYPYDWHVRGSFGAEAITHAVTTLKPCTTYYVVAYATNSAGRTLSTPVTFNTLVQRAPTVTTAAHGTLTATSCVVGGSFTINGQRPNTIGIQYGTSTGVYTGTVASHSLFSIPAGSFTKLLTGLTVQEYYYRAIAVVDGLNYRTTLSKPSTAGTSTWSRAFKHSGGYSVKLDHATGVDGSVNVQFAPQDFISVSDLDNISATPEWSLWYNMPQGTTILSGVGLELHFESTTCTDPNGAGHVDVTVAFGPSMTADGAWHKLSITNATTDVWAFGNDPTDGTPFMVAAVAMSEVEADINDTVAMKAAEPDDSASTWQLTRVRVELYDQGAHRICYVDDVTINGTTILLDGATSHSQKWGYGSELNFTYSP
jgi:hypothetical protein